MASRLALFALLAAAVCTTAAPVHAARAADGRDQAVRQVERRTGGQVISVETRTRADGQQVYRMRVLLGEGRVRVIEVPAGRRR
ncbi:hypothetical protein KBTX_01828 [wastewater metagenome]|uniref:PepSY domain-containing protein n=3 Tax=root TaxID=1 RepID=A0A5B8RF92_9ZZZZ|nr:hypothetical protein [Arhodomonas aquaeolei]MCS4504523.1 hypothetical protein [Arhodomonas aquaeolei]QEA05505.1 hypothetical protein KBTEX_01828 [uncultured organism]